MARTKDRKITPVELQKFLKGVDYPAHRDDLIEHAQMQGADERILQVLEDLPDREYDSPVAVTEEVSDSSLEMEIENPEDGPEATEE